VADADRPPPIIPPALSPVEGLPDRVPDPDSIEEPTADELVEAALDYEAQARLWVRALRSVLELRSHDSDPSDRVQLALDLLHIAVCERLSRICRADLPADGG
jgi:hypothetical protein